MRRRNVHLRYTRAPPHGLRRPMYNIEVPRLQTYDVLRLHMQTPPSTPPSGLSNSSASNSARRARRRRSPFKTFGCGCGGLLLVIVVLFVVRSRMNRITVDTSGLAGQRTFASRESTRGTALSQDQMRRLAKDTLLEFNKAVQQKDFSAFHATVATPFAAQVTPQQMRQAFRSFIGRKTNIAAIKDASAILQPGPSINERGVLHLQGFFPVQPLPVYFQNKYVWQDGKWKLLSIDVQLGAPTS